MLHESSEVASVEIFYLQESVMGELPLDAKPINVLDKEEITRFCLDLQSLKYTDIVILLPVAIDPSFTLDGYVAKISYNNGDYEIVGDNGYQPQTVIDGRGVIHQYSFEDDDWSTLINPYISQS